MIELYAITDHPGPPLPDIAPLSAVARGGLAAICAPAANGKLSPEKLWRHEEVMEALMRDRDILPVRYGTRFEDEDAAASAIAHRRDELMGALEAVRGAVELSVRAVGVDERMADPHRDRATGTDYLRAMSRRAAGRNDAVRAIHEPLMAKSRASATRAPTAPGEVLRAAYLVDRRGVDEFTNRVAELQRETTSLRLLCTGPWPPYSFSGANG